MRIPAGLVDEALQAAPRGVPLTSRSGAGGLTLAAGPVYYGTGSDCLYLLGPGAKDRRPLSLADVEELAALQEKLPNIASPREDDLNCWGVADSAPWPPRPGSCGAPSMSV